MGSVFTGYQFPLIVRAVILMAITGWASLLSHMCISNFNDGARPVYPELIEGRMTRAEFAAVVTAMGFGWVLAGFSQWLGYGLIACHLTLIATDCIGAWSPNKPVALGLGIAYGALCVFGTEFINSAFAALPYNFISDLTNITTPILPIFCLYPAVAISGQFGASKGIVTAVLQAIVYIACTFKGSLKVGSVSIALYPYCFAMLMGMIMLVIYAAGATKNGEKVDITEEEENIFQKNADRIKSNWVYLCIQGGLNALGIATMAQAYQPATLNSALVEQNVSIYAIAMIGVIAAFIPLIVSTALSTGVYQAVGLTTCMLVGALCPWWLAPFAGFAIEFVEIQLLGFLGKVLAKFPELSKSGDHIRDGMSSCLYIAMVCGAFLAGNAIWPTIGLLVVGGAYTLNDVTGQRIPRVAVGPLAAILVGILKNIMVILGLIVL